MALNHINTFPKTTPTLTCGMLIACKSNNHTLNHIMKEKNMYVSPSCETLELCTEEVIAVSGGAPLLAPDFNNPFMGGQQDW